MALVIQRDAMQDNCLNEKEMLSYVGGTAVTAALVNAIVGIVKSFYSMGQDFGSTLRRLISRTRC